MIESDFNSVSVLKVDGEGGGGGQRKKTFLLSIILVF